MQIIKATDLFNSLGNIDSSEFERTDNINIDFSEIRSIDFKEINILLNIKKIAVLNNKKLSISNLNPRICQIFDVTGLDKIFSNFSKNTTNPVRRV